MTPSRKHLSAALWTTVALVAVPVAYPLSLGPACWICDRLEFDSRPLRPLYWPFSIPRVPGPILTALLWWGQVGSGDWPVAKYVLLDQPE